MKYSAHILFLILLSFLLFCQKENSHEYQLIKEPFYASITETGEIQAYKSQMFLMPHFGWEYGEPKIIYLIEEGTIVFPGDTLLCIDSSSIIRFIREKENELKISETEYNKLLLEQEISYENLKNELLKAESAFHQAKLQLKKIEFESPNQKRISQLNFESSKIQYEQKKKNILYKKIEMENNLKIKKLKISQQKNMLEKAQIALKNAIITTNAKGMIVLQRNRATKQKVSVGDKPWAGTPIIGLPDMDKMKAITKIHEKDRSKIKLNQKAIIRLDAFPDEIYMGKVTVIDKIPLKENEEELYGFFKTEILIDSTNELLKPGMTVSCEIITTDEKSVFTIPHSFLIEENLDSYIMDRKGNKIPIEIMDKNKEKLYISGPLEEKMKLIKP